RGDRPGRHDHRPVVLGAALPRRAVRRVMRIGIVLAVCAVAVAAQGDGKTENARGVALLRKGDAHGAALLFKQAIEEDPESILAHYNLACAASRLQDRELALRELAWLGNRGAYDRRASQIAGRAHADRDLRWIFEEAGFEAEVAAVPEAPRGDLLNGHRPFAT